MLIEFPWLTMESWIELVLSKLTQIPKDFCKFAMLIKLLLVNIGNHLRTSVYRDGLTNQVLVLASYGNDYMSF